MRLSLIKAVILSCTFLALAGLSINAQPPGGRGPLGGIERAIADANGPALTTDQETAISTLFKNFFESQKPTPNTDLDNAHKAYNAAVLNGDLATAQAQAQIIANLSSAQMASSLQARAKLLTDVIAVLKQGGQYAALQAKFGDRLIGIIGGPGGRGPGGPGGPCGGFGGGRMGPPPDGGAPGSRAEGFGPRRPGSDN